MQAAERVAGLVIGELMSLWGGQAVYIGQGVSARSVLRRLEVNSKFTGNNVSDLAREYRVSVQAVYKWIREVREGGLQNKGLYLAQLVSAQAAEKLATVLEAERSQGDQVPPGEQS